MHHRRYMVIAHPKDEKVISVHGLLGDYHWHRMDDDHVLLYGSFSPSHSNKLRDHPDVSVMPHTVSLKQLAVHFASCNKSHHFLALREHMGIPHNAQMSHFLDAVEVRLGPVFQPLR